MSAQSAEMVCVSCGRTNRVATNRLLTAARCGSCHVALSPGTPQDIDDRTFKKLKQRDRGQYVIDVWAPWCGPCRMMAPAYADVAKHFAGHARFFKLNSEAFPAAAASLGARSIPALYFFSDGQLAAQTTGAMTEPALLHWMADNLNSSHEKTKT